MKPDPDTIRAAWERYHGPINDDGDPVPQSPPAYDRGYRDGYAAAAEIAELDALRQMASQRGARLQILREWMRETDWLHFCGDHPGADQWFDADGVPVSQLRNAPDSVRGF
ncbi:MAG: hypothetical protein EOM91_18415 [Sphingobacteriia bacterium]|nr:hypothetical protein [Sphingobacteriia bacterium]